MKKLFKGYVEYEVDIMADTESEARVALFNVSRSLCDSIDKTKNMVKRKTNLATREIE